MTAKNRSASAKAELRTRVAKLRSKLDRADARTVRLKSKVAGLEKSKAELEAQVKKLRKRLGKAGRTAKAKAPAVTSQSAVDASSGTPATPDASWTVVRLREEARSRGLTGLSGKSKAQLLAALG